MSVSRVATQKDVAEQHDICKCCPEAVKRTLATMLDFSLLKSPAFLLLAISGFLTLLGMYIPFIYMIERASEMGIRKDDSFFLLSVLGITNAIGRIISGIAASVPRASPLVLSYVSILICGISTLLSVILTSLVGQYFYVSIFGLSIGKYFFMSLV